MAGLVPPPSELSETTSQRYSSNPVSYDLYFATAPGGHQTEGRMTTEMPDGGGQGEESASGSEEPESTDDSVDGDTDNDSEESN